MKILLLIFIITAFLACKSVEIQKPVSANSEKPAIEAAVRAFWSAEYPNDKITGLSFQRFDGDLYLVGTTFEGDEGSVSVNVVARKFENDGKTIWT